MIQLLNLFLYIINNLKMNNNDFNSNQNSNQFNSNNSQPLLQNKSTLSKKDSFSKSNVRNIESQKEKDARLEKIISDLKFQKQDIDETELIKIFERLDADKSQTISKQELKNFLFALRTPVNDFYIEKILKEFDKNNDGNISQNEFVEKMKKKINNSNNGDLSELLEIYKLFDANHDNKICHQDLYNVMMALGESFDEMQCKQMITSLVGESKDSIDFSTFFEIIKDYNNKDFLD